MKEKIYKGSFLLLLLIMLSGSVQSVYATEKNTDTNQYGLGQDSLVNTGKDTGYAKSNKLKKGDPHFGWKLGKFYISGFTRKTEDKKGTPVFLKNVGDTVPLWFSLEQDIDCLNGDENLSISEDKNGWDELLGVKQQNFGRGMLIIKYTDYQNNETITTYQDFLKAKATLTANTQIEMFEEGDYEVALDYEIQESKVDILGWKPLRSYNDYKINFKFSVRNGNCMVFPFDNKTGAELTNTSITENGFYLDLAKSRYLDIDIKKEVLKDGADGLMQDTRFNRPAKDGEKYTDEGIYTITVHNRYTDETTTKVIYVGKNNILKAYVVTGLSISDIESQLAAGAEISDDGNIVLSTGNALKKEKTNETESNIFGVLDNFKTKLWDKADKRIFFIVIIGIAILMIIGIFIKKIKKRHKKLK